MATKIRSMESTPYLSLLAPTIRSHHELNVQPLGGLS